MVTRKQIVIEARTWVGTRYHHQASQKGAGCDCIGLLRGVGVALGIYPKEWRTLPEIQEFIGYARTPSNGQLEKGCAMFAEPVALSDAKPGDILLMRFDSYPQHMGIIGDYPGARSIIHSYAGARKVVEHRIDQTWEKRIVAAYRFPGVEE